MKDADTIKAKELIKKLEEAYNAYYDTSKSMPYDIDKTIRETAICLENAITEINRQKAELTQYAHDQHELMIEKDELFDIAEKQKAEIERLQKYNTDIARKHYNDGRAEAITEFEERLKKEVLFDSGWGVLQPGVIDQIAKELKEGVNNA